MVEEDLMAKSKKGKPVAEEAVPPPETRNRFIAHPSEIVIWDKDGNVVHNHALAKRWKEMDEAERRGKKGSS